MSDRWKSLAEQLGAPGLEPTVRRPRESAATKPDSGAGGKSGSSGKDFTDSGQSETKGKYEASDAEASSSAESLSKDAGDSKQLEVKNKLVEDLNEPTAGEIRGEQSPDRPQAPSPAAHPDSDPASSQVPIEKPKKRSNWERLANLFSLSSESRSVPDDETASSEDSDSKKDAVNVDAIHSDSSFSSSTEADPIKDLSNDQASASPIEENKTLFPPEPDPATNNPVLTEMFGKSDTSLPHEAWQDSQRIVDDIGWEDDQESSGYQGGSSEEELSSTDDPLASDWLKEGKASRGRFKRKRGRRGEDDFSSSEASEAAEHPEAESGRRGSAWIEKDRKGDPQDPVDTSFRDRTDSRDRFERGPAEELTGSDVPSLDSDDEEFVAQRRSSRRRRRRRSPSDSPDSLGLERTEDQPDAFFEESRVDRSIADDLQLDSDEDDSESGPSDFPSKRRRRRRRPRGSQRDSTGGELIPESEDVVPDDEILDECSEDFDMDAEPSGDEHRGAVKKHRSIPSWEESIGAIVDANLENHRRGDQRGYKGSGGRSRGRR